MKRADKPLILVTGATGYVGGRLVPRLLESGYRVRVLARQVARLQGRKWVNQVELVQGDVLKLETLTAAVTGVWATYYLIHSQHAKGGRLKRDLTAARHFGEACRQAGVERIIYLGELRNSTVRKSEQSRSPKGTADTLRDSGVAVCEIRSAPIVGAGSMTFEMIRYLTELLPLMVCPRWVDTRVQPIAIRNLLDYLMAALERSESANSYFEVGGAEVLQYKQMLMQYAGERGLRRLLLQVPVLTPRLSSYWIHWVTPVPARLARPLIESFRDEAIVHDSKARSFFPEIEPIGYKEAVRQALAYLSARNVETTWSDALATSQGDVTPVILRMHDGMLIEQRQRIVKASPFTTYQIFSRLGGDEGWPSFNWTWQLRGVIDRLVGGVGFRRSRRDPDELRVGDALDFWRVEAVEPGHLLRLRAEMRVPGRAWLQFEAAPVQDSRSLLTQTAFFASRGLSGLLYWYLLYPIHGLIFSQMIRKLALRAESTAQSSESRYRGESAAK